MTKSQSQNTVTQTKATCGSPSIPSTYKQKAHYAVTHLATLQEPKLPRQYIVGPPRRPSRSFPCYLASMREDEIRKGKQWKLTICLIKVLMQNELKLPGGRGGLWDYSFSCFVLGFELLITHFLHSQGDSRAEIQIFWYWKMSWVHLWIPGWSLEKVRMIKHTNNSVKSHGKFKIQ